MHVTMEVSGDVAGTARGFDMFGPLPTLHKIVLVVAALVVCVGIGLWVGVMPVIPLNVRVGLISGTVVGAVAAFALVHDFHEHQSRPVRARRRLP
jgi:hypothetical protein